MDSNDELVILAWALVDGENERNWSWFMTNISAALNFSEMDDLTIISDRDKGLKQALDSVLPRAYHSNCCFHLGQNVQNLFGLPAKIKYWKCVYAKTRSEFLRRLEALREISQEAATYIDDIPHHRWATYAHEGKRYGHVTSNLAEICASLLRDIRELPALHLLKAIWNHQASKFHERKQNGDKLLSEGHNFTPHALKILRNNIQQGRLLHAVPHNISSGLVTNGPGHDWEVHYNFEDARQQGKCCCGQFQELLIPCQHACALALVSQVSAASLIHPLYSVDSYCMSYDYSYPAISCEGLELANLEAPILRRPRGRPKVRRLVAGQSMNTLVKPYTCKNCKQAGHNRRSCREPNQFQ